MCRKGTVATVGAIVAVIAVVEVSREPCLSVAESQTLGTLKPILSWTGGFSCIEKPSCFRITTAEAWRQLWLQHTGSTPTDVQVTRSGTSVIGRYVPVIPEIDFTRFMALAIFKGKDTTNNGLYIMDVLDHETELKIRVVNGYYQAFTNVIDPAIASQPLHQWKRLDTTIVCAFRGVNQRKG